MSTPRRTIEMQLMDVHSFPIKRGNFPSLAVEIELTSTDIEWERGGR